MKIYGLWKYSQDHVTFKTALCLCRCHLHHFHFNSPVLTRSLNWTSNQFLLEQTAQTPYMLNHANYHQCETDESRRVEHTKQIIAPQTLTNGPMLAWCVPGFKLVWMHSFLMFSTELNNITLINIAFLLEQAQAHFPVLSVDL